MPTLQSRSGADDQTKPNNMEHGLGYLTMARHGDHMVRTITATTRARHGTHADNVKTSKIPALERNAYYADGNGSDTSTSQRHKSAPTKCN